MANKFRKVVNAEDDSHDGLLLVSGVKAKMMVAKAESLITGATKVVAS